MCFVLSHFLGFLCYDAVAGRDEKLRHGAEEPPRSDLFLAVHGGDTGAAAAGYLVGHYHAIYVEDFAACQGSRGILVRRMAYIYRYLNSFSPPQVL